MAKKPYSEYTDTELAQAAAGNDPYPDVQPSGLVRRAIGDPLAALAAGTASLPSYATGLADIPTGGAVGNAATAIGNVTGFRPAAAADYFRGLESPELQAAKQKVNDAQGFMPTLGAIAQNPSYLVSGLGESLPSMAIGAGGASLLTRGALAAAKAAGRSLTEKELTSLVARNAAIGEGATSAGQNASQVEQDNPNATWQDIALQGVAGGITGAIGYGAGKLGTAETAIGRKLAGIQGPTFTGNVIARSARGALTEGILQELPQSAQEQIFQNLGENRPWDEGVASQAAQGAVLGAVLGGGAAGIEGENTAHPAAQPVDVLGTQRAAFNTQLAGLKDQYTQSIAAGTDPAQAFANYQQAAQAAKEALLQQMNAPAPAPDATATPTAPVDTGPTTELLQTDQAQHENFDHPVSTLLDALPPSATGEDLAKLLDKQPTPEAKQLAEDLVKTTLMEAGYTQPEATSALADISTPATAQTVLDSLREVQTTANDAAAQDVAKNHPELVDELFPPVPMQEDTRPAIADRVAALPPEQRAAMQAAGLIPATEDARPAIADRVAGLPPELRARMEQAGIIPGITKAAAEPAGPNIALDLSEAQGISPKTKSTLGNKLAKAVAGALLGAPHIVRDSAGKVSVAGTKFVESVYKQAQGIASINREIDSLSAKVAPRLTDSTAKDLTPDINKLITAINFKQSPETLLAMYTKLRSSIQRSSQRGATKDKAGEAYKAAVKQVQALLPTTGRGGVNITNVQDLLPALQQSAQLLSGPKGTNVTGGKFENANGENLAQLNDRLYAAINKLVTQLGGTSVKGRATARANIDRIVAEFKSQKFAKNQTEAAGDFQTDEQGNPIGNDIKARNEFDRQFSMAWRQFKDREISRTESQTRTDKPLSAIPQTPVRNALETGAGIDASKSPLADAYENGYLYDETKPDNKSAPGVRAVLSYLQQNSTGMARTMAAQLKYALESRMDRIKGGELIKAKDPVQMHFATPEEAQLADISGARWYSANSKQLAELRKLLPNIPQKGELVIIGHATPEAVFHELFHAATANWIVTNPTNDSVLKLAAQLDFAIKQAETLQGKPSTDSAMLQEVMSTLQAINAAGERGTDAPTKQARRVVEFVAYGMTRAPFQAFLAKIHAGDLSEASNELGFTPAENKLVLLMSNVWNKFKDIIARLLNIKSYSDRASTRLEANRSFMDYVLTRVMLITDQAMEANIKPKAMEADITAGTSSDSTGVFSPAAVAAASKTEYKGRSKLISMHINDFLRMAKSTKGDVDKLAGTRKLLAEGTPFSSLPQLFYYSKDGDAVVEGHEGRHRAIALREAGYSTMPVIIRGNIRWSEQADKNAFDYEEHWPKLLLGESSGKMEFPVSREDAAKNYAPPANTADMDFHMNPADATPEQTSQQRTQLPPAKMNIFDRVMSTPFRMMGWEDKARRTEAAVKAQFDGFVKAHPSIAGWLGTVVENINVDKTVSERLHEYVLTRSAADYLGNRIEDALHGMGQDEQAAFMDALLDPAKRAKLAPAQRDLVTETENAIKDLYAQAAATGGLDKELKDAGIEGIIQYTFKKADLATKGFSAAQLKLSSQKLVKVREAANVLLSSATDPSSERYYPVYAAGTTEPDLFIAANKTAELVALGADTTSSWALTRSIGSKTSPREYEFSRNKTFAEIKADSDKVVVANYLANTLARLSKVVAARRLIDHIEALDAEATKAGQPGLMYNDLDALQAALGENVKNLKWDDRELGVKEKADARRPDFWVQVNGSRWGNLDGKYINGAVLAGIRDIQSDEQFITSPTYQAVLRYWKKTKTVWSPATHVTNGLANFTFLYLHDIPLSNLGAAAKIFNTDIQRRMGKEAEFAPADRKLFELFKKSGAVLGNYSANELHRKQTDELSRLRFEKNGEPDSVWQKALSMMDYETKKNTIFGKVLGAFRSGAEGTKSKLNLINKVATGAYEIEDNVFRFAAFMSEFNKLKNTNPQMTEEQMATEAGAFARKAMLDYSINASGIKAARQTLLPFMSFTYRAVPMMVRMAYLKPWKFLNMAAAVYAINALGYAMAGGDEDEDRKNMPEWMQQRLWGFGPNAYVRMPWGDPKKPVFMGLGKFLPTGDLIQSNDQGAFGIPYFPAAATPTGPVVALIMSMAGYDSFQGRSLWNDTNSWTQNAAASLNYLGKQMAPTWGAEVVPGGQHGAIYNWMNDKKGMTGADINNMYAITRYLGSRMYERNIDEARAQRALEINNFVSEYNKQIVANARAESRYGHPDFQKVQDENTALTERFIDHIKELRGEE